MRTLTQASRPPRPATRGRPPTPGLREGILRAAEGIFTRRDYHAVQMDDVARAADVGKGTLYRYFRSKRDLHHAVVLEGIERLRGEIEAAVGTSEPPARKIERVVRRTLGFLRDRRRVFALIHRDEHEPDDGGRQWSRRREQLVRVVAGVVEQAIAAGHVRPVDARIATEMLLGMLRGATRHGPREDDLETSITTVVDVFMRGVGTPAGRRAQGRSR